MIFSITITMIKVRAPVKRDPFQRPGPSKSYQTATAMAQMMMKHTNFEMKTKNKLLFFGISSRPGLLVVIVLKKEKIWKVIVGNSLTKVTHGIVKLRQRRL